MAFNITPQSIISNAGAGLNLLSSVAKIDILGVLDQDSMQQIFPEARPVNASIRESARVMDYPVETGAILSDHKVILPTEIEIITVINALHYSSAYQALRNAWINSTLLSVQTRTGTYRNMVVAEMPHEESPDMFNAITQTIRLREVLFVVPSSIAMPSSLSSYAPRDPVNQPVTARGLLSALPAAGSALSYFHALSVWGL
jgi:hypothetical protein